MAAASAVALTGASDARAAFYNDYCGVLIWSGSWCGDGSDHTYDTNRGWYSGSGSVQVCERLLYSSTHAVRWSPACGNNYVFRDYGAQSSTNFEAEVQHLDGNRHTIYGRAVA